MPFADDHLLAGRGRPAYEPPFRTTRSTAFPPGRSLQGLTIIAGFFDCRFLRGLLAAFLLIATPALIHAQGKPSKERCFVCNRTLGFAEPVWTFQATNYLCEPCTKIPERCVECGVPTKEEFLKTTDGRIYCRKHRFGRVFDEYGAGRLFLDATDELRRIARGEMELRDFEVQVKLFDTDYWNDAARRKDPGGLHKVGFSHTRRVGNRFNHGVVLLSGQPRQTLSAVCAHEYAHLWMNENRADTHAIDPDVVEAICELAAWKLMEFRNAPDEMEAIRTNSYTRGRILDLIRLEKRIGFGDLLKWVRTGTERVPPQLLPGAESSASPVPESPVPRPLWVAAPPPAGSLELQGVVALAAKMTAIINGVVFTTGDEKTVPLGGGRIAVRCLAITATSASISTNGSERIELGLRKRP